MLLSRPVWLHAEEDARGEWEEEEAAVGSGSSSASSSKPEQTCYRLRSRAAFWRTFTVSTLVLSWVLAGVQLQWGDRGPPADPIEHENHGSCVLHADFLDEAVAKLLAKGAIAAAKVAPVVVSPLSVIVRRGKKRMVLDLSDLNSHLAQAPRFTYETIATAATVFQPGDWMFPIDLQDAYHHVDMHPSAWKYLGFRWRGQTYVFKVLPFGLSWACWVFTKLTNELVTRWRRKGIRVHHYLDDFGFAVPPDGQGGDSLCRAVRQEVLSDIRAAGFLVQEAKLEPPSQRMTFLGFIIDSVAGRLYASAVRAQEVAEAVASVLAAGARVPARQLARVAGQLASLQPALGNAARIFTRSIHRCLPSGGRSAWRKQVEVSTGAREELQFWQECFSTLDGQPLWPSTRVDTLCYSDAGGFGWGGYTRRPDGGTEDARGYFTPAEQQESSTQREAWALLRTLQSLPGLAGRRVRAVVDNMGLDWCWNGGSRVPGLNAAIKEIFLWCRSRGISLAVHWLPRCWNQRADQLSKHVDRDDWQLEPSRFKVLDARWGPHTFDRFATDRNALCPQFSSAFWCPGTAGIDAFSFDWAGTNSWCNPPFHLIPRVIEHLRLCAAAATVICPVWPSRPWWHYICPDGTRLADYVVDWVEQPRTAGLFRPGQGMANTSGVGVPKWRVLALRVDFTPGAAPRPAQRGRRQLEL